MAQMLSAGQETPSSLRGDVIAEINFLNSPADSSAPFVYVGEPPPGKPRRNYTESPHRVSLKDIRGHEVEYTLEADAFQIVRHVPSAMSYAMFHSDAEIRAVYYPEVEQLILSNVLGAQKVLIFDHTIRKHDPGACRQPVSFAHVDQTPRAAEQRLRRSIANPEEEGKLIRQRYRIINVWRPLNGQVESMPLSMASARSVEQTDLMPIQRIYTDFTGETMGVRYNHKQQWLYLSQMANDERILLQCTDSKCGIRAGAPHAAFRDPRSPENAKPRESIEVRALVFD